MLMSTPALSDAGNETPPQKVAPAGQAIPDDTLQRILHDSGILSQLTNLSPMIIGESSEHWQNCKSSDAQLAPWLKDAFAADKITRVAIDKLQKMLDTPTIISILQWLDSPTGQAIIRAEHSSASLSEDDFERYISELDTSPAYRTERAPRIRSLIHTTGAGNFVSVLNTELNGIVSLSIACSPSSDTVQQLLNAANTERQNISLVSFFMGIDLLAPTAVVYRDVENRTIDDYLMFSKSPAGKAYHAAMISVTRDTLVDRMEAFADRLAPRQ